MMNGSVLDSPIKLGEIEMKNRILMAPMTRARVPSRIPDKSTEVYYAQRAGAGLIITEATTVSQQGDGTLATPGIYNAAQIAGWKRVTGAVHESGGRIMCQLWHSGRVAHASMQPNNEAPVSASDVHGNVNTFTANGFERTTAPRALRLDEIPGLINQFRQGARNAREAGFDGVEIHAGSGYLLDQFMRDGTNRRDDHYGGSIANRCRVVLEIVDAVIAEIGGGRTAIRISPMVVTWECHDSDPVSVFSYLAGQLGKRNIAFLDMIERNLVSVAVSQDDNTEESERGVRAIRSAFTGVYVANGAYNRDSAIAAIESGYADAVSFGREYISTPDLAQRFQARAALNPPAGRVAFYGGAGDAGYIDFPSLS